MCDYAALDAALHNIEKKKKKNRTKTMPTIVGTEATPKQSTARMDVLLPLCILRSLLPPIFPRVSLTNTGNLQRFAGTLEWYVVSINAGPKF